MKLFSKMNLGAAMALFGQLVESPVFLKDEIEPLRERILADIAAQDADWFSQSMRHFKKAYFEPRNSPYQFSALGTVENVKGFTRDQVAGWYEKRWCCLVIGPLWFQSLYSCRWL